MAQKLLISKPTKNVKTVTSPNDFYLDSDKELLKIAAFGTFSIDSDGGHVLATITHSLGYKPYAIVYSQFCNDDGSITNEYYQLDWDILLGGEIFGYQVVTSSVLEIRVGGPVNGSRDILGFYYLFYVKVMA